MRKNVSEAFVYLKKEDLPPKVKKLTDKIWKICRAHKANPRVSVELIRGTVYDINVEMGRDYDEKWPGLIDELWALIPWGNKDRTIQLSTQAFIHPAPTHTISEESIMEKSNKKISFKDFLAVDYVPGEPEQVKLNAKKRKKDCATGNTNESIDEAVGESSEKIYVRAIQRTLDQYGSKGKLSDSELDDLFNMVRSGVTENLSEAGVLNFTQRRARAMQLRKNKNKVKMGARRQKNKVADRSRLVNRSKRDVRSSLFRKLSRGKSKGEVPLGQRVAIDRRLARMGKRIERIAMRMLPKVRKMDIDRKTNRNKGTQK